ncbi:MAG: thioesterase [Ruminococcaceae bacterium]|nr:thioesterase [Oscillospiraceae bacterium]MBQ9912827.1 thioesterase family protein [Clostridia bacterium]
MNIETGTRYEVRKTVTDAITAAEMGSGSLAVLATPAMVALMEQAASELCEKYTEDGITTVGTSLNIQHLAATAVGAEVKAVATVVSCDGRKVTFEVEAYDNAGLIGKGTHERFSIKSDKFMLKAEERKNISAE